ncbi:tumor necrosis factor receptor superfamily member 11B-like isoform X2 [Xyrauchen texanus]|uniref:tumor necrosis factor receptor superfamily member 11B-like isoform X2 n=1 Tax=Xyrauchen texanus TaxID=154827 RepID=UPI002242687B|nr:tumor necrosis factor receptor superfamily member 11B-like isoform X2 [Xyrauchen texanus]
MILFTVVLLSVLSASGSAAGDGAYQRVNSVTGEVLMCRQCPPGFRLRAHCTGSHPTKCVPCEAGLYTEYWNTIPNCLRCDACTDHQRVVRACNGTVNTLCTPHTDTVCELCADGQFTDITQEHAACVTHSSCGSDEQLVLTGSKWHDNVCATCNHITEKGWVDLFRPILSSLFAKQKTPVRRLQRFVNCLCEQGQRSHRRLALQSAESPMGRIQHWISRVSEENLLSLPQTLKESHLEHLANKITLKIRTFLKFKHQCNNRSPLLVINR